MARRDILCACLGALAIVFALLPVSFLSDRGASASRDVAQSATVVYVALRAVNAALSVSQEIEVGASLGASASAQPLKVLEPVDDTIERIAGAVFAIAAVAWIISVAFQPVSTIGFVILGLALLVFAARDRLPAMDGTARVGVRLGLSLSVVLPLLFVAGTWIGALVTEGMREDAVAVLQNVADEARTQIGRDGAEQTPSENDEGWFSGMWASVGEVGEQASRFSNAADYYWTNADNILEAAFKLIAVFMLRVFILPVLLLFVAWRLFGRAL